MPTTREEKRAALQERLIDAAEAQIAEKGLRGLKAREVTAEAGCAVGALYNAFDDLDMLIVHVNSRTLLRMGAALKAAAPGREATAAEKFRALAVSYVAFASENRRLWTALFEHRLPDEDTEWPEWHLRNHAVLIELIVEPLARVRPDLPPQALVLRARTLFAAVHGVVHLALGKSVVGVPRELLEAEVVGLVDAVVRGSELAEEV
ncbi:TetR/AcrR family transcriptional regulator [Rhodovulum sp. DZ06]|uniref:TetR/AcrR family transcriptional regulator n=1 Tax=Rhodovulum sp. DZ06 TaxID=3425126 RepID=UPI003D35682C